MKFLLAASMLLFSQTTLATGGFEKPALWSADAVAVGEAVDSSTKCSQALFFNPAGLACDTNDVSLNLSSLGGNLSVSQGPNNSPMKSTDKRVTAGALMSSYQLSPRLGLGFGIYGLGGLEVVHEKVSYTSVSSDFNNFNPDIYGKLQVIEAAAGFGFKITEKLSFGGALRAQSAESSFSQASVLYSKGLGGSGISDGTPVSATAVEIKNLKGNDIGSYKLGIQYNEKNFGIGVMYRSKVSFTLKGDSSGKLAYSSTGSALVNAQSGGAITPSVGTIYDMSGSNAAVTSSFPEKYSIASHYNVNENNTIFLGYSLTKYSDNKELTVSNTSVTDPLTGTVYPVTSTPLQWQDLHDYKIGWANNSFSFATLKFGYVLSSQVTNTNYAGSTFASPSKFHHFSTGASKKILNNKLKLDLAIEHYRSKGIGSTPASQSSANLVTPSTTAEYKTSVTGVYMGASFYF